MRKRFGKGGARSAAVSQAGHSRGVRPVLLVVSVAMVLMGIAVAVYPSVSQWQRSVAAERQFSEVTALRWGSDGEMVEGALRAAREANGALADGALDDGELEAAADRLDVDGNGVIAWLEIPKLGVKEPVYRDCSDEHLMFGCGLVPGTSLPVGGEGSNAVVVGHSGMRSAQMLDRLGELAEGDAVVFWTLGEPCAYRVTGVDVVLPEDAEHFAIERGRDLATLVTCTPIGVNSHRIVVRAERSGEEPVVGPVSVQEAGMPWPAWLVFAAASVPAWLLLLLLLLLRRRWWLVRVEGERPLSECEVADASADDGPYVLDKRLFRRARLRLFGAKARGSMRRLRGERKAYAMEFEERVFGPYVLQEGEFVSAVQDGELLVDADAGANTLVFARRKPRARGDGQYGDLAE